MAQILDMPQLSDTMEDRCAAEVAQERRCKRSAGRGDRRGRDRQGGDGLRGVRRGRAAQAPGCRRRLDARRNANRDHRQGRRGRRQAGRGGTGAHQRQRQPAAPAPAKPAAAPAPAKPAAAAAKPAAAAANGQATAPAPKPAPMPKRAAAPAVQAAPAPAPAGGKVLASPLARRLATDLRDRISGASRGPVPAAASSSVTSRPPRKGHLPTGTPPKRPPSMSRRAYRRTPPCPRRSSGSAARKPARHTPPPPRTSSSRCR